MCKIHRLHIVLNFFWTCFFNAHSSYRKHVKGKNIFYGRPFFLTELYYSNENSSRLFYLLFDEDESICWVSFTKNEFNSTSSILKTVNSGIKFVLQWILRGFNINYIYTYTVSRNGNSLEFQDDFNHFQLVTKNGKGGLHINPYITW